MATKDKDDAEHQGAHAKPADEGQDEAPPEPELKKDEQGRTVVEGPPSSSSDKAK